MNHLHHLSSFESPCQKKRWHHSVAMLELLHVALSFGLKPLEGPQVQGKPIQCDQHGPSGAQPSPALIEGLD